MSTMNYEKPKMKFVDLRNDETIATNLMGNCMPQAAQESGRAFYFDAPGDGWVNIIPDGKNCNGKANFIYFDNPNIPGEVSEEEKQKAILDAQKAFETNKQAFSGAAIAPDPTWS